MFIQNEHFLLYFNIINKALLENRKKQEGVYYERHHIYPRSIFPEKDKDKNNNVLLTAKEHFICHELLTKFTEGKARSKMMYALWMMCNAVTCLQERNKINSDEYQMIRESFQRNLKENHHNKGKHIISEKGKKNISKAHLGVKRKQETCNKIGLAHKGKKLSNETKNKIRKANLGKKYSKETKQKHSKLSSGKNNGFYNKKHSENSKYENALKHSKGLYITPWGTFISAKIASEKCNYTLKIDPQNINKWCRNSCLIKFNIPELKNKISTDLGFKYIPSGTVEELDFDNKAYIIAVKK